MPGVIFKKATARAVVAVAGRVLTAAIVVSMMLLSLPRLEVALGTDEDTGQESSATQPDNGGGGSNTSPDLRPSVLLVDASLGDLQNFRDYWLGENFSVVAQDGDMVLLTVATSLWWTATNSSSESADTTTAATRPAPPSYLLGNTASAPLTSDSIAWALDRIAEAAAANAQQSKTVIVAAGATGLQARLYAEDLGQVRQSARADVVGLVFLGTPHAGYSIAAEYPKLEIWQKLAAAAGLETTDLAPGSEFLTKLNNTALPSVIQLLQIQGQSSNFGFGITDAATVVSDMSWPQADGREIPSVKASVTISRAIGLAPLWGLATNQEVYGAKALDADAVLRLPTLDSYFTSAEVMAEVRDFYQAWFPEKAPVTQVSSVLVLDISGSMLERLESGGTKQAAEIDATTLYLQAVSSRSRQSFAVPEDVTVIVFDSRAQTITSGYDGVALRSVADIAVDLYSETDIGLGLEAGLDSISGQPRCAEKHILLLSDGLSTVGMNNSEILSGPAAQAAQLGVVIDAVALGDMSQSDAGFLEQIATATGGVLYQNRDIYGLLVSFLSSRYSALGLGLVDVEVQPGASTVTELGTMADNMRSLEIGVLADGALPAWRLLLNGTELDAANMSTNDGSDGFLSIDIDSPAAGTYAIELTDATARVHIFAVGQLGVAEKLSGAAQTPDNSLLILAGAGALLLLLIVGVIINGVRKSNKAKKQAAAAKTGLEAGVQSANEGK